MKKITLFDEYETGAEFSSCKKYRYALWRIWDKKLPLAMFIGLNPSKAGEDRDDATIRRVKHFSKEFGYGGFYMMNLFAVISTDPKYLKQCDDPLGENDHWLEKISFRCKDYIFCCGSFKEANDRLAELRIKFPMAYCLGITKEGYPKHPLYLSQKTKPIPFN
jgi:hypothetical protein